MLCHRLTGHICYRCDKKWNESGFRPPLCTYRLNWARRAYWGWWDDWLTLSSRHRIRNSSPGGLRPSTLPLGHGGSPQYWLSHVDGEETFLFLSNRRDREPNPELYRCDNHSEPAQYTSPILIQCWANVVENESTLDQHRANVLCLLDWCETTWHHCSVNDMTNFTSLNHIVGMWSLNTFWYWDLHKLN